MQENIGTSVKRRHVRGWNGHARETARQNFSRTGFDRRAQWAVARNHQMAIGSLVTATIPASTRLLSIKALTIRTIGRFSGRPSSRRCAGPGENRSQSTPFGMSAQRHRRRCFRRNPDWCTRDRHIRKIDIRNCRARRPVAILCHIDMRRSFAAQRPSQCPVGKRIIARQRHVIVGRPILAQQSRQKREILITIFAAKHRHRRKFSKISRRRLPAWRKR